jgi:hypothetical protein
MLPMPIDLDASMETIGSQPERSYWPPTAPTSPLFTDMLGGVDLSAINGTTGQNDVNANGMTVPLWGEVNSNNLLNIQPFEQGTQTMGQVQYDPNDPRSQEYQLPVPEVPTSSLAILRCGMSCSPTIASGELPFKRARLCIGSLPRTID